MTTIAWRNHHLIHRLYNPSTPSCARTTTGPKSGRNCICVSKNEGGVSSQTVRWMSSTKSLETKPNERSLVRGTQQQRRQKKRLAASSKKGVVVTTKDRIRVLLETNQQTPSMRLGSITTSASTTNEMLRVAQGRMSWVRNRLYTYWNPDYKEDGGSSSSGGLPESDGSASSIMRQWKPGVTTMDGRWWFWQVWFALLPAIAIAMYCEFRGKHLMHEFHRSQELIELQKLYGTNPEEWDQEQAMAAIMAREEANREPDLYESTMKFINDLKTLIEFQMQLYLPSTSDGTDPADITDADKTTSSQVDNTGGTEMKKPPTVSATSKPSQPLNTNVEPDHRGPRQLPSDATTVHDLLYRIQQLEKQIGAQNTTSEQPGVVETNIHGSLEPPGTTTSPIHNYTGTTTSKSGVRNRVEDELLQKWKPYMNTATHGQQPPDPADSPTLPTNAAVEWLQPMRIWEAATNFWKLGSSTGIDNSAIANSKNDDDRTPSLAVSTNGGNEFVPKTAENNDGHSTTGNVASDTTRNVQLRDDAAAAGKVEVLDEANTAQVTDGKRRFWWTTK